MEPPPIIISPTSPRIAAVSNGYFKEQKQDMLNDMDNMMSELHATQYIEKFRCMEWSENFNPRNFHLPRHRIQKIGTMYVVTKSNNHDAYENLHGNNLPGVVGDFNNVYSRSFEKIDVKSGIFNARIQLHAVQQDKNLHKKFFEVKVLVRKYLNKVANALKNEDTYTIMLHHDLKMNLKLKEISKFHLPRLGKVYAEFTKCMRAWNEVTRLWSSEKMHHTIHSVFKINHLITNEVVYAQDRMLQMTKRLILRRLQNIGELSSILSMNGFDDVESVFAVSDLKRFCKLIEVYNHFISLCPNTFEHSKHFCKINSCDRINSTNVASSNSSIKIEDILNSLSIPAAKCMSLLFSQIFSEFSNSLKLKSKKFQWTDMLKLKISTIQLNENADNPSTEFTKIVKAVGSLKIPFPTTLFNTEENKVSRMLRCQKQFLISFFSTFASSSSLLRKTLLSHNSQISRLTPSPIIDDSLSVMSSEDGASLMYQCTGIRKTVMWRDSWDMDSVMSVSNRCLQTLTQFFPSMFLTFVELNDYSKMLINPQLSVILPPKCYWGNQTTVCYEILIFNLSNLQVLPDVIIKCCNEAMGSVVISSVMPFCDSKMTMSLAFSLTKNKKIPNLLGLDTNTYTLLQIVQSLLVMLTKYSGHYETAHAVLPYLECVLDSSYLWLQKRIDEYLAQGEIELLLSICLRDLHDITENSLDCLQQVEVCHNTIESKRSSNLAGLHVATFHLKNIDNIITHMQELTASTMKRFSNIMKAYCDELIAQMFPKTKSWLSKAHPNDMQSNEYVNEIVANFLTPSCKAVDGMNLSSQMTVVPCVANCIFERIIIHLQKSKPRFSMPGAKQLKLDFECIMDFFFSDNVRLIPDVQEALKMLRNVRQAFHIVNLLMCVEHEEEILDFHSHNESLTSLSSISDQESKEDDKFWLSLRLHSGHNSSKKSWKSTLPCI